jgi:epoxyqueuosine reductase
MNRSELTAKLKQEARELGFELAGACPAVTPTGFSRFAEWLDRGFGGEMQYLSNRQQAYSHPEHVLAGVRSLFMLAVPYRTAEPMVCQPGEGRVSRYAWNERDYHDIIHERLKTLIEKWQGWCPDARIRGVVDTAPLFEREFAQLAGLGWVGKNTLLLNKSQGSWFFLAALLTNQELDYDTPHEADHCGTCRACLDACPTQAFPQPYVLDATRCISYLTIELRGQIPMHLRTGTENWIFGCDVCQDVCPWNHRAPLGDTKVFGPLVNMNPVALAALFQLDDHAFRQRFRHTPLWRPRRRGLLRNAAIVLGNQRSETAIEPLSRGLADSEAIVRGACAWALGRIGGESAKAGLAYAAAAEVDPEVRDEIQAALAGLESPSVP